MKFDNDKIRYIIRAREKGESSGNIASHLSVSRRRWSSSARSTGPGFSQDSWLTVAFVSFLLLVASASLLVRLRVRVELLTLSIAPTAKEKKKLVKNFNDSYGKRVTIIALMKGGVKASVPKLAFCQPFDAVYWTYGCQHALESC